MNDEGPKAPDGDEEPGYPTLGEHREKVPKVRPRPRDEEPPLHVRGGPRNPMLREPVPPPARPPGPPGVPPPADVETPRVPEPPPMPTAGVPRAPDHRPDPPVPVPPPKDEGE